MLRLFPYCVLYFSLLETCHGNQRYVNVARGKDCSQSTQWYNAHPSSYAVNGNTGGDFETANCIVTADSDTSPWWEVNLGSTYPVYNITVWARAGYVRRMSKRVITVDGTECYRFPDLTDNDPRQQDVTCTRALSGTRVRLVRDSSGSGGELAINLCEFEVKVCNNGYWGSGCASDCGSCSGVAPCDKVTGHCDSGCAQPGIAPPMCTQACPNGTFGNNCTQNCSQNCVDTRACNNINGQCTCKLGWKPPTCVHECPDYTFGQDCLQNCSRNCDDVCNKVTGNCTCKPGWKPPSCTEECPKGRFGQDCNENCSEHCEYDVCESVTGYCTCSPGWTSDNCTIPCADYTFGTNCSMNCSSNCDGVCEKTNGDCTCKPGWKAPHCSEVTKPENADVGAETGVKPPVAVIAGPVAGGIVVIALVTVVIVILVRRRRSTTAKKPDRARVVDTARDAPTGHVNTVYENVGDLEDSPADVTEQGENRKSKPVAVVKPELMPKPKTQLAVYENIRPNGDFVPTTLELPGPRHVKSTPAPARNVTFPTDQAPSSFTPARLSSADAVDDVETADDIRAAKTAYYNDAIYMTSQAVTLGLDRVQQYLLDKLRGHTLDGEFEKLLAGHQRDCVIGSRKENRPKNRFNNSILPYDANRVVLQALTNDYINASHIRGYISDKSYIAAQGPKKDSIADFWQMVWQEKTTHIVMLTNLTEGEKNKCAEYWPSKGNRRQYGSVGVTGLNVEHRANYVIRTFEVNRSRSGSSRHVTQYHFVTWPDHHVPTATALVDFWRTVVTSHRNQRSPAPLLVHCSAGVGRTGTFIALDIAMDGAQNQSEIDIFHIVQRMREDRVNMVQTKSQYRFVHEAILEAYTSRHTRLALLAFNGFFPDGIQPSTPSDRIDLEFKLLNQMKVLLHKPSHTVAEDEENTGKNRTLDILPDDGHLAYLSSHVRGRNQYINAVHMPTFFNRRGCILTQLPLYHTLVDIWRLVDGNDVITIISLGAEVDDSEADCCYWPREEGQTMKFGPFTVTLGSKASLGDHVISYQLSFQKESYSARDVYVLQYTGWTGEMADNTADLMQLVDLVNNKTADDDDDDDDNRPVIVQCLDGATKSGLFRVICDVTSRMTSDRDVDVYMAARHVQIVRPECVASLEQYRYIYHVVQEYQRRNAVYNN